MFALPLVPGYFDVKSLPIRAEGTRPPIIGGLTTKDGLEKGFCQE